MEIGIVGLPKCGKTTVFNALSSGVAKVSDMTQSISKPSLGMAKVMDSRLGTLEDMFQPQKTTPAEVRYIDFPQSQDISKKSQGVYGEYLNFLQRADALLHVVRSFEDPSVPHMDGDINPYRDLSSMEMELAFSDLAILERRVEKLNNELKSSKSNERDLKLKEKDTLSKIKDGLEMEIPIREQNLSVDDRKMLSNFQFLTAKPTLIVWNVGENDINNNGKLETELKKQLTRPGVELVVLSGKIEMELSDMDQNDSKEFREFMGIEEPGLKRAIMSSYELLGLISFFTVGPDEVKAWTIEKETLAVKAAGKIHSDIERGFIRAEVMSYQDLTESGSINNGKKKGLLRLEGKTYPVQDGDVINFLFNV